VRDPLSDEPESTLLYAQRGQRAYGVSLWRQHQDPNVLVIVLAVYLIDLDREYVGLHMLHAVRLDQDVPKVRMCHRCGYDRSIDNVQGTRRAAAGGADRQTRGVRV